MPTVPRAVVFGPGSLEMRLITSKLSARSGICTSLVAGDGTEKKWRRLMYGNDAAESAATPSQAQLVIDPADITAAFDAATTLCVVCDEAPLAEGPMNAALDAGGALTRVVLLSQMGVTRATKGFFGGAGANLLAGEARFRDAAAARGLELSIVRVGTLKGGGPGRVENNEVVSGVELGLAKEWYNTLVELEAAMATMAYDKFTLGAACAPGDPVEPSNMLMRMAARGSFAPKEDETSRVVAAGALVAAMRAEAAVEVSVSSAKGEAPPTDAEWDALLATL